MTNEEKYDMVFCTVFGIDESRLDGSLTFAGTPEWDSMAHMELIAALEDAFDVMLEPDEIVHFESYEHGKEIIAMHEVELG